ncbi:type IV toxin-antitoxin system AbiEi family antitoxin domain-containing protein [Adlercreutzia sp. ZJ141]|uniref:type IV toxin-antitoxin system AbiEi family antitoxin domain-containing protein n=1 Tax=Adlercreutzia sp. ZJ141 TaxID=2709406 RepID=UPI0013ECCAAA|nr:type IV toxin-antitoxin system AbiEi family antitoxin domain-containing protein [Adlercreutzia sp. ZJ141]
MEVITDIEKLREVALDQHGFVTSSQAEEVGVSRPSLSYLVKHGRIERLERGIYRIPQVHATENDIYQLALLWAGKSAFLSHDTALASWDICDINPTVIHVTVPKRKRIQKQGRGNVVLHRDDVSAGDLRWWDGMRVASPSLAVRQSIERGVSSHIIVQAIEQGRTRGLIDKKQAAELEAELEARGVAGK